MLGNWCDGNTVGPRRTSATVTGSSLVLSKHLLFVC